MDEIVRPPCRSRFTSTDLRRKSSAGFTLIEITISIVILASSLVVLLGLQAATVQRAVQDRSAQQAMLIAREVLSAIEITKDPASLLDTSGRPEEVLRDVLKAPVAPEQDIDPEGKYDVELVTEDIELPIIGGDKLRRVTVTVRWLGGDDQGLVIDYYIAVS